MDCVTSIAVPESYVIQKPLIYVYGHMVLDIKYFFDLLFILYWSLNFSCLGSKIIKIIIFILNTLTGCFMHIKICSMRIHNTLEATSEWILWINSRRGVSYWLITSLAYFLLLQQHHGGTKCCSRKIQNVSEVAQCAFKK